MWYGKLMLGVVIGILVVLSTTSIVSTVVSSLLAMGGAGSLAIQARAAIRTSDDEYTAAERARDAVGGQLVAFGIGILVGGAAGFWLHGMGLTLPPSTPAAS